MKSLLSTTDHSAQVNGYAFLLQLLLSISAALKKTIIYWCVDFEVVISMAYGPKLLFLTNLPSNHI